MPVLCSLLLLGCVAVSRPLLPMGMNDDWAYIWTARKLAETGHVVYNGWDTAMLGWQLYLGALFIKVFGFSFLAVRSSVLLVSVATAVLLQRFFVRLGIPEKNAGLATLTMVLSPLFLPLAYSFMSDVPGLFVLLLCLYACVRAIEAEEDRAAGGWLAFAALSNAAGGSARQIAWLGVLVVVPCAMWLLRRRRLVMVTGAVSWLASVAVILGCMHWFKVQPYTISEPILLKSPSTPHYVQSGRVILRTFVSILLMLLPVLGAFLVRYPPRLRRGRDVAAMVGVAASLLLLLGIRHNGYSKLIPFSGPYVTPRGLVTYGILGQQAIMFPTAVRVVLTVAVFASFACFLRVLWHLVSSSEEGTAEFHSGHFSSKDLLILLGPLAVASVLLLLTRTAIFDRYYLALLVLLLVGLLRTYQEVIGGELPALSMVLVVLFAIAGIASMHDTFSMDRARVAAAEEMQAKGVPRTEISAGFEYDGTTELQQTGYVNEARIRIPAGAYHPMPASVYPVECRVAFADRTPSIKARYVLAHDESCFGPSRFPPVAYRTWLPWRDQVIYVREVPAGPQPDPQTSSATH